MTTVGLFGTCGNSRWREPFITVFDEAGIPYFNPQLPAGTWTPGAVAEENRHLATDEIVLFPITSETSGIGSLGEIGFSALHAIRMNRLRTMIFLIDDTCEAPDLGEAVIKESNRLRALVKSKVREEAARSPSIFLVNSLEEMLGLVTELWHLVNGYNALREQACA